MFKKILIANRGEIACRVMRTARQMSIACVAVYSDADKNALHVLQADEAVHIGASPSSESYLKGDLIIKAALESGAEAIHPGYGFLSENAEFSKACHKAGIAFIGPSAKSITAMGLKDGAKAIMEKAGVPVVPGYQGENQDPEFLKSKATEIGYPVLIKAVAGGGGKGMRLVEREDDFLDLLGNCQREGKASFGNDHVLIEKYITKPRHIEVQVFGDTHGNVVHLFERDCSLQRRHQKVVEEAPAPDMSDKMREAMGQAAVKAAEAIDYHGAGTIEFIVDVAGDLKDAPFYFMEMNTRLQVEHPVTEMITGVDLVEWQLRVAAGEKLPRAQKDLSITGHSFEVRLYAEDPAENFLPQTGRIHDYRTPENSPQIRIENGVETGHHVTAFYDPMIAKLITYGETRSEAAAQMKEVLERTYLAGLNTNQEFLHGIFQHPEFLSGDVDTGFIPRHEDALLPSTYGKPEPQDLLNIARYCLCGEASSDHADPWNSIQNWRMSTAIHKTLEFSVRGEDYILNCRIENGVLSVEHNGETLTTDLSQNTNAVFLEHSGTITAFNDGRVIAYHMRRYDEDEDTGEASGRITTSMPGRIVSILVKQGEEVEKDQPLLIMESMKVEITIKAGCDGMVNNLPIAINDQVADGALLVEIEAS